MGLLTETNEQYYAGHQTWAQPNPVVTQTFTWTGDTSLVATTSTSNTNFAVYKNNVLLTVTTEYTISGDSITLVGAGVSVPADVIQIRLLDPALWANYGGYSYITLTDVINNFMVAYVGMDKLIPRVKRSDVLFHAKRGLQEFSYDTLKSIKSQELTIPPSLSVIIPQDYVNYVEMSRIDDLGVKHIIYPTTLTSNPYKTPIQDGQGVPTQDNFERNLQGTSITNKRWKDNNLKNLDRELDNSSFWANIYGGGFGNGFGTVGGQYGIQPEIAQINGWFTINERENKFSFSSDLSDKLIILSYISDGLAIDSDTRVPKMAEEAMYAYISHAIISTRSNQPEYVVNRLSREKAAKLRNAKIRLSNIKLEEFTQIMRGKSKWIKN